MPNFLWGTRPAVIGLLTTELNALATGSGAAIGPEINNLLAAPAGWLKGDLELLIASSSLALTSSSFVSVYFVPTADGTNYPKYTSGTTPLLELNNYWAANIMLFPGTLAAEVLRSSVRNIAIPSAKFKAVLISSAGVTLPATGNTLSLYPTPEQY